MKILWSNKGFTLVEVCLVAAMMGFLMFSIFSVYSGGIRIWRSVKSAYFVEGRRDSIAIKKMKKELSGYIRDFEGIMFEGDEESVTFPYVAGRDIVTVTYEFDRSERALLRKAAKFTDSLKDKKNKKITKLFDAYDVEFSYLYYDEVKAEGSWISSFSEEDNEIPTAIKMDIRKNNRETTQIIFIPR